MIPASIHTLALAAATALGLTLGSCSDNDGVDGLVDMTCTDIVTFAGNTDGRAVFTMQVMDDSPLITYTAQRPVTSGDIAEGDRMLISYVPADNRAYTSGPIQLLGGQTITQSDIITEWRDEYDRWNQNPVYVYSAWRTGTHLNLHIRLTYSVEPRLFCLAVDPATLDTPWPEAYLVHAMTADADNHDRAYYSSFDISEVWSRPGTEGIKLHIANSNLDKHIFTFAKSN